MTPTLPVRLAATARRAAGRITSTTGMPRPTVYRSRASRSTAAEAVLHAMTSILTPASTRSSITASAWARTSASGLGPYGLFRVSPMYSTDSFGSWSRIARATVRPPTPESKIPMGASFTGASLVAEFGGHDLHERLLHPRQGDVHRPERGSYRSYLELDRVVRLRRVAELVVAGGRVRTVPERRREGPVELVVQRGESVGVRELVVEQRHVLVRIEVEPVGEDQPDVGQARRQVTRLLRSDDELELRGTWLERQSDQRLPQCVQPVPLGPAQLVLGQAAELGCQAGVLRRVREEPAHPGVVRRFQGVGVRIERGPGFGAIRPRAVIRRRRRLVLSGCARPVPRAAGPRARPVAEELRDVGDHLDEHVALEGVQPGDVAGGGPLEAVHHLPPWVSVAHRP